MQTFTLILTYTNVIGIGVLVLLTVWLTSFRGGFEWQSNPKLQFNWHPMLLTVGMIILNGHAILAYRILKNTKKFTAKLIHAFLNIFGFIFTVIGLKAVFDFHNLTSPPISNMYTLHSWIGLISVIIFSSQWVAGFITFLYPGLDVSIRANIHPIHIYIGVVTFAFASISALLGYLEKAIFAVKDYSSFSSEGVLINCLAIMTLIYSTLVVYLVLEPKYRRSASTEVQTLLTAKENVPQGSTDPVVSN